MESRDIYRNLSPLDHRYWLSNREVFERLSSIVSELASVRYCAQVEAELCIALLEIEGLHDQAIFSAVRSAAESIDPAEVAAEEEKTQHNVRALVHVLKRNVPDAAAPYIHLGATSVDILDTAASLRLRDAVVSVLIPETVRVVDLLCNLAEAHAQTPQIGRTHGQFAVPITFGFAISEYASRLSKSIVHVSGLVKDLRGKIAGAVGAYNATSIITGDPTGLEERVLSRLGLKPSDHSTQLVEPEHSLRVLLEINIAFGVLANLADDMRNLQRSEISETREAFTDTQVGSSTMPHKRNPWNWEHVKSLWKAYAPRVLTFYMDQISEHQRDLTNSASTRFVTEYLAGYTAAVHRTAKVLSRIEPDTEYMSRNLATAGDMCMAEPAYILLALAGESDAHEQVRRATLTATRERTSLLDALKSQPETWSAVDNECRKRLNHDAGSLFARPEAYRGRAVEQALANVEASRSRIAGLA
ncbi:MAG: lyase family protein [Spirochaetaceae bacterium]